MFFRVYWDEGWQLCAVTLKRVEWSSLHLGTTYGRVSKPKMQNWLDTGSTSKLATVQRRSQKKMDDYILNAKNQNIALERLIGISENTS